MEDGEFEYVLGDTGTLTGSSLCAKTFFRNIDLFPSRPVNVSRFLTSPSTVSDANLSLLLFLLLLLEGRRLMDDAKGVNLLRVISSNE